MNRELTRMDGGALHSALELARVSTPMKLGRYGARIDATPQGTGDVQHADIGRTMNLPHLQGAAAGHIISTYKR